MKIFSIIFFFALSVDGYCQEKVSFMTPPSSPEASFTQQLGNAELTVTYSRPLARGRKIFGELVPFDSLWRTGAGGATTISLTEELLIGGKTLSAGKYTLFTIPRLNEWTVIINSDSVLHGSFGYDSKKDIHRFTVPSIKTDRHTEAFTILLNDLNARGAGSLDLFWETTMIKIPVDNPIDLKMMEIITNRLLINKEKNSHLLYQAANFYYQTGRDLMQAASWVAEAEQLDKENFDYPNLHQKILADLKDYKGAIQAAKRAIVLGEKKNMTNAVTGLKKRIAIWEAKKP